MSQVQEAAAAVRAVWRHLDDNRSAYSGFASTDVEWAIQNGKIVEQATYVKIAGTNYRDISMAANMEWEIECAPEHICHYDACWTDSGVVTAAQHAAPPVGSRKRSSARTGLPARVAPRISASGVRRQLDRDLPNFALALHDRMPRNASR